MNTPSSTTPSRTRTATGHDDPSSQQSRPTLSLSPIQVVASCLASVTAAVVASYFGVAGTIIGTAVVSVASTVGAALYAHSLRRGKERLKQTRGMWTQGSPFPSSPADPTRPSSARRAIRQAGSDQLGDDEPTLVMPSGHLPLYPGRAAARPSALERLRARKLPVIGAVVATFVLALAIVTIIEAATGAPLARTIGGSGPTSGFSVTGGSSNRSPATTTSTTSTTESPVTTSTPSRPKSTPAATSPSTSPRVTTPPTTVRSTTTSTSPSTSSTTSTTTAPTNAGRSSGSSGSPKP